MIDACRWIFNLENLFNHRCPINDTQGIVSTYIVRTTPYNTRLPFNKTDPCSFLFHRISQKSKTSSVVSGRGIFPEQILPQDLDFNCKTRYLFISGTNRLLLRYSMQRQEPGTNSRWSDAGLKLPSGIIKIKFFCLQPNPDPTFSCCSGQLYHFPQ